MNKLILLFFLFCLPGKSPGQDTEKHSVIPDSLHRVVLMKPTGKMIDDLPEMVSVEDTTQVYQTVFKTIENSFVSEFLDLYFLAQVYLRNHGKTETVEPAYIALTENQGGFAKTGFALRDGEKTVIKPRSPYVDITTGQATAPPERLMSFTQLYPHEMGHVLYHMLSPEDSLENNTFNVDMHFFSIVTDFSTAFNEGFAEHIENVSRMREKNEAIREGIFADVERIGRASRHSISGFKKDFKYPFRLGYYKASMLNWYQKYEDYKRHVHAISGDVRFQNAVLPLRNAEDQLTYRNSGVELDKGAPRNYVQLMSSEGAVSAFFTHLTDSDLAGRYADKEFYRKFLWDSTLIQLPPGQLFSPVQNQFLKYMHVLHNHVVFNNSSNAQLTDFIDGYMLDFPSEAPQVREIFRKALGVAYTNDLPPPLWILVREHKHRLLVFDPFDAITVPLYTFDLNAAQAEDLMTIEGLTREDAATIINYRDTHGFFTSWEAIENIPGVPQQVRQVIVSSALDKAYFEETLEGFEPELSIASLIASPLKYIMTRAAVYFFLLFGVFYFAFLRGKTGAGKSFLLFLRYFLLWISLVLAGLIAVFMVERQAFWYVLGFAGITALLPVITYRRKPDKKYRTLVFTGLMLALIFLSVL